VIIFQLCLLCFLLLLISLSAPPGWVAGMYAGCALRVFRCRLLAEGHPLIYPEKVLALPGKQFVVVCGVHFNWRTPALEICAWSYINEVEAIAIFVSFKYKVYVKLQTMYCLLTKQYLGKSTNLFILTIK